MLDLALALGCALLGVHLLSIILAWRKCSPRRIAPATDQLRVSLVRPICGLEFKLEETLQSSFAQNYHDYEIIFCVAHADDAALSVVRRLIATHHTIQTRILIGEINLSQNPKLNNMASAWPEASGDVVIFADSNLLLPPDYCSSIAGAFEKINTVVVSSPPVGDFAESFFGEVECAMLNTHAARWQFAASAMGINFAQGKTLAFRRSAFDDNLMYELGQEPAEDAAATKIVRSMGRVLNVLAPPYTHPVGQRTARSFWSRHVRWARLRRATFPAVFAIEAGCGVFPALLAFAISPTLSAYPLALVAIATIGVWYGAEFILARALGWRANVWFIPACLMRDALLPAFYVAAWISARFEWRGRAMDSASRPAAT